MKKKKIQYPDKEKMIVIHDSIVAICNRSDAASKLLSVLLYWYEHSDTNSDAEYFSIRRTQAELSADAVHLIDEKTIHNTAVPALQFFGYLTIKEQMGGNIYTLNIGRIQKAIVAYGQGEKALIKFLMTARQLETFPITITESQLESILINRKGFRSELESILIANRNLSNCKRGRKASPKEASGGKIRPPEIIEIIENNIEITTTSPEITSTPQKTVDAHASQQSQSSPQKNQKSSTRRSQKQEKLILPDPEPDLSGLTEQERLVYDKLLSEKDRPIFLAWDHDEKTLYTNFLGSLGFKVPLPIGPKVIEVTKQNKYVHYSIEDFINYRKRILQNDRFYANRKPKPKEKQFYAVRGVKYWDILREASAWADIDEQPKDVSQQTQTAQNIQSIGMSETEAKRLAQDIITSVNALGYKIDAHPLFQQDRWIVNMVWDGTIETYTSALSSRRDWEIEYKDILIVEEIEKQKLRKQLQEAK